MLRARTTTHLADIRPRCLTKELGTRIGMHDLVARSSRRRTTTINIKNMKMLKWLKSSMLLMLLLRKRTENKEKIKIKIKINIRRRMKMSSKASLKMKRVAISIPAMEKLMLMLKLMLMEKLMLKRLLPTPS